MLPRPAGLTAVVKKYPAGVAALRGVTLEVPDGDQVAVVGPSGSGKTTMLTIMGTLERSTSGSVRVAGHDIGSASDRDLAGLRAHEIGFVFQEFHLQEAMSVVDNVALGMLYTGDDAAGQTNPVWAIDLTVDRINGQLYAVWSGWEQNAATDRGWSGSTRSLPSLSWISTR